MARTVKEEDYVSKRNEILNAAERLVYTRGYGQMTINDIRAELKISSGAFYHYFDSKPAVLEALIERMQQQAEQLILPIIEDANLTALEKLQRFLNTLESASATTYKAFVTQLLRVWFADDNALVREKVYERMLERRGPLLNQIVRQGIAEDVFKTPYPDRAGEIILWLARGMGSAITHLIIDFEQDRDEALFAEKLIATYAAYADALERVLGAPPGFLHRPDVETARALATKLIWNGNDGD